MKAKQDKIFEKEYILSQFKFDAKVAEVFMIWFLEVYHFYKETMKAVINHNKPLLRRIHQYTYWMFNWHTLISM